VLSQGKSQTLEFELTADEAAQAGMICGGRCAVLVEPIEPGRDADVYEAVAGAVEARQPVVVVTVFGSEGDARKIALVDGEPVGGGTGADLSTAAGLVAHARPTDEGEAAGFPSASLRAGGDPALDTTGALRVHLDPIIPPPTVFIFGAGHVALPVAHIAALVGFRVVVIDDRPEFANRERFPSADEVIVASVEEAFGAIGVEEDGYVVAITRGHAMDEEVVAQALRTPARYIGMIGSKRKVAGVVGRLRERGFSDAELGRLHAPIGIDIEAETVEEIAVSIIAELIRVRRSR
jgi:xanthine dehydrogenase accessory factor